MYSYGRQHRKIPQAVQPSEPQLRSKCTASAIRATALPRSVEEVMTDNRNTDQLLKHCCSFEFMYLIIAVSLQTVCYRYGR